LNKIRVFFEMIKFEHSIFVLPFAFTGLFIAADGSPSMSDLLWITVAMVGARSLAMTLNRLLDHTIDSHNPRTAGRALPAGKIKRGEAWFFAFISLTLLLLGVYRLAPICRYLWPPLVLLFFLYPYMKRFTWASHFILGICLGLAPVAAWIAVTGSMVSPIWLLGAAVALWAAGFDIIYACQDIEVDRRLKLFSLPSRFGPGNSLVTARFLHLLTLILLVANGVAFHFSSLYYVGLVIVLLLLIYEHHIVHPGDLSRIDDAFFTTNGLISVLFFLFSAVDLSFGRMI
jgi:4-hydroxybenzoate polyprenyltransferase